MDAHNYLLAAPNLVDLATLSGGVWDAPLTNLQTRPLKEVARTPSTSPAVTWFDVTLARRTTIRALGLINHNLTRSARIRWQAYADPERTQVKFDTGWERVWPRVWPMRQMDFRHKYCISGVPDETETEGMTPSWERIIDPVSATFWRCHLSDQYNPSAYLQGGRLVMAKAAQPDSNASFGSAIAVQDSTVIDEMEDGGEVADVRPRRRLFTFNLDFLSEEEAKAWIIEMQRRVGIWGEVMFCMNPASTRYRQHNTIWGRFNVLNAVTQADCIRWTVQVSIIEITRELSV